MLGSGVFQVDDSHKSYEDLKKKGVQFAGAPEDRFNGISNHEGRARQLVQQ